MNETPREIAEEVVTEWADAHQVTEVGPGTKARIVTAIEAALKARDGRAAEIADKKADTLRRAAHVVQQPTEEALRMAELAIVSVEDVARTIRGSKD